MRRSLVLACCVPLLAVAQSRGAAVPPAPPATPKKLPERVTTKDVAAFLAATRPGFAKCAEEQQRADPTKHGALTLTWWVNPDGHAYTVTTRDTKLTQTTTYFHCAIVLVREWEWPKARQTSAPLRHTFRF